MSGRAGPEEIRELAKAMAKLLDHETQKTITEWADATFGYSQTNLRMAARANEEMAELLRVLAANDEAHEKAAEEVADVFIVLYRLADYLGVDIHAEIDRKMAVNRRRQWKVDATGHGYHVKGVDE